ncbi:MAG: hypothetical protein ACTSUE_02535 [Promethearchaeota archaeon]
MSSFSILKFTSRFFSCDETVVKLYRDILDLELSKLGEFSNRVTSVSIEIVNLTELVITVEATDFIAFKTAVTSLLRYMEVITGTLDLIGAGT